MISSVLLSSSTAVINYAYPAKISISVQITFKTSYIWQTLSAESLKLRIWIWPLCKRFGTTAYTFYCKSLSAGPYEIMSIDSTINNLEATLLAILIVTFFTYHCLNTTTRKGREYKIYKIYEEGMRKYETNGRYLSQLDFQWSQKLADSQTSVFLTKRASKSLHWQFVYYNLIPLKTK